MIRVKEMSKYEMYTGWSAGVRFSLLLGHRDRLWSPLYPLQSMRFTQFTWRERSSRCVELNINF